MPTVQEYAYAWLAERRRLGNLSVDDDEHRLRKWILPRFGERELRDVFAPDVRAFVLWLRSETPLAPRTVRNVYTLGRALFRDAREEGLVPAVEWQVSRRTLPPIVDADPNWRAGAVFERHEVELLIADERVPADRRVLYALKALAGLRHGDAARLRWCDYDRDLEPLGALYLRRPKCPDRPRAVPVHEVLRQVLTDWRVLRWPRVYGRNPRPEDLIVPTRAGTARCKRQAAKDLRRDLAALGLRRRRGHDLRAWFWAAGLIDGAIYDALRVVVWGVPVSGNSGRVYGRFPWPLLCAEVAKLRVAWRRFGDG